MKRTEIEQLICYCSWAEEEGTYYGNREQFWKRHNKILIELEKMLNKEKLKRL